MGALLLTGCKLMDCSLLASDCQTWWLARTPQPMSMCFQLTICLTQKEYMELSDPCCFSSSSHNSYCLLLSGLSFVQLRIVHTDWKCPGLNQEASAFQEYALALSYSPSLIHNFWQIQNEEIQEREADLATKQRSMCRQPSPLTSAANTTQQWKMGQNYTLPTPGDLYSHQEAPTIPLPHIQCSECQKPPHK